jgi:lysophospholipid acyltransferase
MHYPYQPRFANYNWFYKTLWLNVMVTLLRAKYLSGWSFSEASIASSGFTFNGFKEGQPQFQRIKSIDIEVDKTYNINEKAKMWNISVQRWLGRYVYQRVHDEQSLKGSAKKQNDAQMITYLISAFWHGFYPGYYSSFLQWGIMAVNAKYFYKASLNLRVFDIFDNNKLFWVSLDIITSRCLGTTGSIQYSILSDVGSCC